MRFSAYVSCPDVSPDHPIGPIIFDDFICRCFPPRNSICCLGNLWLQNRKFYTIHKDSIATEFCDPVVIEFDGLVLGDPVVPEFGGSNSY